MSFHTVFNTTNDNSKLREKLYSQIISENYSEYKCPIKSAALLKSPDDYNLPRLIEKMMADLSDDKYNFVDMAHYDFDDFSEMKTATIRRRIQRNGTYAYLARITNVKSKGNNLKSGGIRIVITNPFHNKLHFLFVSKASVYKLMHTKHGKLKEQTDMEFSFCLENGFAQPKDKYGIIEFDTVKELAMIENH
jgi:predicted N-acyltransferase